MPYSLTPSFQSSNKEIAEAISLADTFDIDATSDGEVWLHFGFKNARIPIFLKEKGN